MQFIENIFLLQCLKKEIATAKELDLRPLGKVIIFRDRQTQKQNLPIIYRSVQRLIVAMHRRSLVARQTGSLVYAAAIVE